MNDPPPPAKCKFYNKEIYKHFFRPLTIIDRGGGYYNPPPNL